MLILLIEDDVDAARSLQQGLEKFNQSRDIIVDVAYNGEDGLRKGKKNAYEVIVVDRLLPERDGLSVIRALRRAGVMVPTIVLSALNSVDERVQGLRAGADDYLAKPYEIVELVARLRALVRRSAPAANSMQMHCGDLSLDLLRHKVVRGERLIALQPREFRLLEYLMRHSGQIVTRSMLLEHVWDFSFDPHTNVIDVQISRLRAKIDKDFEYPLLQTVRGQGYRLMAVQAVTGAEE